MMDEPPETRRTIIAQTTLPNGRYVSTIHIPILASLGGPYETMVFEEEGNWGEIDCARALTYEAATKAHQEMCEKYR